MGLTNSDEQAPYSRNFHSDAQVLMQETAWMEKLFASEMDEHMMQHLPFAVQILCENILERLNGSVASLLVNTDGKSVDEVIQIGDAIHVMWISFAFRLGWLSGKQGKIFDPCYCDVSEEVRNHVDGLLQKFIDEQGGFGA